MLFPKSYKEVLQAIEPIQDKLGIEGKERINYENIRNHQKRHLPFEKRMVREIIEKRAREKNRSILDAGERLLTAEAFYEIIVAKGFEGIALGYDKPTLTQTMHAMDMLSKLEKEGKDDYRPEDLLNQLDLILTAIREVVPPAMREEIFNKIEEYQGNSIKKPKKNKPAMIEADGDYIDEDLEDL